MRTLCASYEHHIHCLKCAGHGEAFILVIPALPRPVKLLSMMWRLRVCLMLAALLAGVAPRGVWATCCVPTSSPICHMAASHCTMAKGRACCHKANVVAFAPAPATLCPAPQTWKSVRATNPRADAIVASAFVWPPALGAPEISRYKENSFVWISERRRSFSCRAPPVDSSVTLQEGG